MEVVARSTDKTPEKPLPSRHSHPGECHNNTGDKPTPPAAVAILSKKTQKNIPKKVLQNECLGFAASSSCLTGYDDGSVLVQALEKVLLQGVVVKRAVDVGGADGGVGHADLGEVSLALALPLVPAVGVGRVPLSLSKMALMR